MKVGILTYQRACNFGANLQLLSTVGYFKRCGYSPIVINYIDDSLELFYRSNTPTLEFDCFEKMWNIVLPLSRVCYDEKQIARVISEENIEAVIVGSDAVAQHHPFLERVQFPTRSFISIRTITRDRMFPNPFWGTFADYLDKPIPICQMSVSSQDSAYSLISRKVKGQIRHRILNMAYSSVRDDWTQKMFANITKGQIVPNITPDPVFAFNYNSADLIPTKDYIIKKYNLPEKYVLFSFLNNNTVTTQWLSDIESIFKSKGVSCIALTFPQGIGHSSPFDIQLSIPIDPIDWYAIIKYSFGYIGHNMHPIIVCIHNDIPFFSFDNYGIKRLNGYFTNDSSSKIKHILGLAGLSKFRISCLGRNFTPPEPQYVVNLLEDFNHESAISFAQKYYVKYENMMDEILKIIKK